MEKILIGGYISVRSVLEAKSRQVHSIIYDKKRYAKVMQSNFHETEKRQYETLHKISRERKITEVFMTDDEFLTVCENAAFGGIAAYVGERFFLNEERFLHFAATKKFLVILDGIEDPYNFGHILRTLYACGVDGLILPTRNYFQSGEIVIKSSAGASELIDIMLTDELTLTCEKLKKMNYRIIATAKTENALNVHSFKAAAPVCVVFGGEKRGIGKELLDICDTTVKIRYARNCPFSLSSTSAVSIVAYEIAKKLKII